MLDFIPVLQNIFKLNEKDIEIYLDLLKNGQSAASTVAARTNIDRTSTYSALKRLTKKGLVVSTKVGKITFFVALDPEVFEDKLVRQLEDKEILLKSVRTIIPQMRLIKNKQTQGRPRVQIFEGPEGIISLYEQILRTSKKQDVFLTIEKMPRELKEYLMKRFMQHKKKLNVFSRVIVEDSKKAKMYKKMDANSNRETRIVPKGNVPFEAEIIIGENDEVVIIDFQDELIGLHIKSKTLRNTLFNIFQLIWR